MKSEIKERIAQIRRGAVPSGYRKAAVGIIPSDWTQASVGEVCEINPPRSKTPDSVVTFLGMADVSEDGRILNAKTTDYAKVSKGFTPFQRGDVLVAKITPCFENGKGADTADLPTAQGFGSTEFHVLRSKICSKFVFYHTSSYEFRKKLETEMSGSAGQKRVQTDSIASYLLPLPPLEEQRRIAEILTTQDKIIALKERRLAEKRRQKTFLAQRLLTGKTRLPGFDGEWTRTTLGAVLKEGSKTRVADTSEYRKITVKLNFKGLEFTKTSREMADKRPFYIRRKNEIIVGKQNYFNGSVAVVTDEFDGCICSNAIMSFSVVNANVNFVASYISQENFLKKYEMLANGTGQKELSEKDFLGFVIEIPTLQEQQAIAEVLTCADREIAALQRDLELEKRKKKALMQLLLTGVVRVNSRLRSA
ncbi:MAG: restriction endonuclease subunit S [Thermoguttaceae bacterium]|nr:restriction endonuclease subunit S [Thermoguttaceae bacterium]